MQSKGLEWDVVFIIKVYIISVFFFGRAVDRYGRSIISNTFLNRILESMKQKIPWPSLNFESKFYRTG